MYINTGPDHFLHAKVYADVASGGLIATPIGQSAAPMVNPRDTRTKSGIIVPRAGIFPVFNTRRKRR